MFASCLRYWRMLMYLLYILGKLGFICLEEGKDIIKLYKHTVILIKSKTC